MTATKQFENNNVDITRKLYGLMTDDEDARVCKDIPDSACNDQPTNYLLQVSALLLTKTGDKFVDQKIILAWLLSALGSPAVFISLLVPIREAFALLPQLLVARFIRVARIRKWYWCAGALGQAVAVLGFGLTALWLQGVEAGWAIVILLLLFSLSRGVCSVSQKDVLGKTISKTKRGGISGYAESGAGFITIGLALWLLLGQGRDLQTVAVILFVAAALWVIAALVFFALEEKAGATEGGGNAIVEAMRQLSLMRTDNDFRLFVITRACLLGSALLVPYVVAATQVNETVSLFNLGGLLLAGSIASFVSGPIWGRLSDRSSRITMSIAGLAAGVVGLLSVLAVTLGVRALWLSALAVFLLYVAHAGVRVGRKTQLVDMAGADNRASYVAVSNTLIGVALVLSIAVAWVADSVWSNGAMLVFSLLALVGAVLALRLPEAQK